MDAVDGSCIDSIGPWSEIKLDLIEAYMKVWAKILGAKSQAAIFCRIYIDAFAGAGVNRSRATESELLGSPLRALSVVPKLHEYIFIEKDERKYNTLKSRCSRHSDLNIVVRHGDSNSILLQEILPRFKTDRSLRGLLLVDPYGLHYNWEVIRTAGRTKAIDLIFNFPISDALRNALRRRQRPDQLHERLRTRWNLAWGDETWQHDLYRQNRNRCLFENDPDFAEDRERVSEGDIAKAYKERIKRVAGFNCVSEPFLLRNSQNSTMFYLFLASQKAVATKVMDYIFKHPTTRRSGIE